MHQEWLLREHFHKKLLFWALCWGSEIWQELLKWQGPWLSCPCTIHGSTSLKNTEFWGIASQKRGLDETCGILGPRLQAPGWAATSLSQDRSIWKRCTSLKHSLSTSQLACPSWKADPALVLQWPMMRCTLERAALGILIQGYPWCLNGTGACPLLFSWVPNPTCKDNARRMCCQPQGCLLQQLLVPS